MVSLFGRTVFAKNDLSTRPPALYTLYSKSSRRSECAASNRMRIQRYSARVHLQSPWWPHTVQQALQQSALPLAPTNQTRVATRGADEEQRAEFGSKCPSKPHSAQRVSGSIGVDTEGVMLAAKQDAWPCRQQSNGSSSAHTGALRHASLNRPTRLMLERD